MSDKTISSKSGGVSYGDNASDNKTAANVGGDFIARDKIVNEALIPGVAALHQLPPSSPDFTGREEELAELRRHLTAGATISGLQGMGGIGKTALALKLADEMRKDYPDGQFYLDLKGVSANPLTAADAMRHVIYAYYPAARLPEDIGQLEAIYRSVLNEQRALLLMDNTRDADQVAPLIPPASCLLLVTSRSHFMIQGLHSINLSSMRPEEAKALLVKIAPRIGDDAAQLAELCGYLPLALELAANALKVKVNISPGGYCRRLKEARLKVLDKVGASLKVSYYLLDDEQQSRWSALSIFPDSFDDAAVASVWTEEIRATQDELGELLAFSLLEWNETIARYRLHDLAREYAATNLNETERESGRRGHAAHYQKILATAEDLYLMGGDGIRQGLALFDEERVNIEAGWKWAKAQADADKEDTHLCIAYPDCAKHLLVLRQHPREQIVWLETMLAAARRLNRRDAECAALGNLGLAYADLGEAGKAIDYNEQALIIHRELRDRRGEGSALGNLGMIYMDLHEMSRGIEYCKQHLELAREIADRRGEAAALGNLGKAHVALNEAHQAIKYSEQALRIHQEMGDRRGEGSTLGNLGSAYRMLGEIHIAIDCYDQTLVISQEIRDRRGEAYSLHNKALAFNALNDRAQAITLLESALEIYEQIEDPWANQARAKLKEWQGE